MHSELYHRNKPEIIPFYVKYIMLIPHEIHTVKSLTHITEVLPISGLNLFAPILQCCSRSRMSLVI